MNRLQLSHRVKECKNLRFLANNLKQLFPHIQEVVDQNPDMKDNWPKVQEKINQLAIQDIFTDDDRNTIKDGIICFNKLLAHKIPKGKA